MRKKKKVQIIVSGPVPGFEQPKRFRQWLSEMPELDILAEVGVVFAESEKQTTANAWTSLAQLVYKIQKAGDGVVILHPLEEILFASSAISFLVQNPVSPVVFTGSQPTSREEYQQGLKSNLINAVQVATMDFSETCLMFGNRLIRANTASRSEAADSLNLFNAPTQGILGRIDFSIRVLDRVVRQPKEKLSVATMFSDRIALRYVHPLISNEELVIPAQTEALVVNAVGYSFLPDRLVTAIGAAPATMPVLIWSTRLERGPLTPKNVMIVRSMTWETTVVKLGWALPQAASLRELNAVIEEDAAGEVFRNDQ